MLVCRSSKGFILLQNNDNGIKIESKKMFGMFWRIKDFLFGNESSSTQPVTLSKQTKKGRKVLDLDMSSAVIINFFPIARPNFEENRMSREYWEIHNKGVSFYNRKWYKKAKDEFLKLLEYENLHPTSHTYLLRTYRKIIKILIEKRKFQDAYEMFKEFFNICKEDITNTDKRKFNKLINELIKKNPNANYEKMELLEGPKKTHFEITETKQNSLKLLSEIKVETPKRKWNVISNIATDTLYMKRSYNQEEQKYDNALFVVRKANGNLNKEFKVNHGIYRFKAAENSKRFIVSSDDMVLYLYSTQGNCLGTYSVKKYAPDKYHMRCVDISAEGQYLLFTHVDTAYLMDCNFKIIGTWKTPLKDGWEKRTEKQEVPTEYQKHLSILGLFGKPTTGE